MIAKNEWFGRRKYTGWWVTPKTWQGWLYIFTMIAILFLLQSLGSFTEQQKTYIAFWWIIFLLIDIVPVMINIKKDEREYKIEAVSERNAAWIMSLILAVWIVYQTYSSWIKWEFNVDYFLFVALFAWVIVKSISNYILEKRWE